MKDLLAGGPLLGLFPLNGPAPAQVGYVVADRTANDLSLTAMTLGLSLPSLCLRSLVDDPSIDISRFEKEPLGILFELLSSFPSDVRFAVVDPLIVFTGVDTNKYHLNAAKLIRINRFAMDRGLTILGTHHATKARSDFGFKRAQDRISGSSALLGYTSTQLFLSTPEEHKGNPGSSDFFEWTVVSHHAAPRTVYLSREEHGFQVQEVKDVRAPKVPMDARIMSVLAVGPAKAADLMQALDISRATLHRHLQDMQTQGVIVRMDYGVYRLATKADHRES